MDLICLTASKYDQTRQLCYEMSYETALSLVLGGLGGRTLWCDISLGQTAINNKVMCINETALVAGEENCGLRLLDSLAESTSGEVDFAAESLGLVVAEELL